MDIARARGTAIRRAAPGGRRATNARGGISRQAGRAATELERMRPSAYRRARRSRSDTVVERIKRLV